jgi:hypothetical protein
MNFGGKKNCSFVVYRWSKETQSWIHVTQLSRPESETVPGSFTNIQSTISVAGDWPSVRVGLSYYRWVDTFDVNINGTFVTHTRFATTSSRGIRCKRREKVKEKYSSTRRLGVDVRSQACAAVESFVTLSRIPLQVTLKNSQTAYSVFRLALAPTR